MISLLIGLSRALRLRYLPRSGNQRCLSGCPLFAINAVPKRRSALLSPGCLARRVARSAQVSILPNLSPVTLEPLRQREALARLAEIQQLPSAVQRCPSLMKLFTGNLPHTPRDQIGLFGPADAEATAGGLLRCPAAR
jgi:hypothetical protein